ncbi:hypothetical protein [Pseudomonas sp. NPDC089569]|uniref:hypothetical protein n=1 Tax=Pseudomonas sp. NPDC089569 TaxID=3390722 RepID=UPI003CFC6A8D
MNTLTEPPGFPFPSRQRAVLMYATHPVLPVPDTHGNAFPRSLRRALPCPAF